MDYICYTSLAACMACYMPLTWLSYMQKVDMFAKHSIGVFCILCLRNISTFCIRSSHTKSQTALQVASRGAVLTQYLHQKQA